MIQYTMIKYAFISMILAFSVATELDDVAKKIVSGISNVAYSLTTSDTHRTMDCLKVSYDYDTSVFGIFHAGNPTTHFSQLYYSELDIITRQWKNTVKLSDRGSQGTVVRIYNKGLPAGFLVGYELQNPNGNKIAIRYYENQNKIKANNFLYQYQLSAVVSSKSVRNVGTVSIQEITLTSQKSQSIYNQYSVNLKFHYSPDGAHDFPGYGYINLKPLRDFVDKTGRWIGGCYQNYHDWLGSSDTVAEGALRQAGCSGKIGQRDYFYVGSTKYYLYQCNVNPSFDWYSWRIAIYSPILKQAKMLGLALGGDIDIANPHISLILKSNNSYSFLLSFFLPSEGIHPDREAKAGQCLAYTQFTYP